MQNNQANIAVAKRRRKRNNVMVGSPIYNEITQFLFDEAGYLDDLDFTAWSELLAEDLVYIAPLRSTRAGPDRDKSVVHSMYHFEDDYTSIMGRVGRLGTESAWAEDPPSRTRRFVTNIRIAPATREAEYEVTSYILLARNRYEASQYSFMTAKRNDLIRGLGDGEYELARREIIVDQAVLGMANLAVFL
jgi:3-phenylpropionate/cinnamic acid dioxygenase small subunit